MKNERLCIRQDLTTNDYFLICSAVPTPLQRYSHIDVICMCSAGYLFLTWRRPCVYFVGTKNADIFYPFEFFCSIGSFVFTNTRIVSSFFVVVRCILFFSPFFISLISCSSLNQSYHKRLKEKLVRQLRKNGIKFIYELKEKRKEKKP